MPYDEDQIANLEAEVDDLVTPTTEDVLAFSQDYDAGIVAASALQKSLNGGGGGGDAFNGGTITEALVIEPTDVSAVALTLKPPEGTGVNIFEARDAGDVLGLSIDAAGAVLIGTTLTVTDSFFVAPGQPAQAGYVGNDHVDAKAFEVYGFTGTGDVFNAYDSDGNVVFQVQADGSVHILTGATVVADL